MAEKTIKLALYVSASEIEAACVAFHKRGQTFQTEAHRIACSVLQHVGKHGDIRVLAKFLASFPEMSRVNAVRSWFEAFGPVAFDGNDPSFVRGGKCRLGEAMQTPFWKFKPEAEYTPLDAAAALENLIKKLRKDAAKTGIDHTATIEALKVVPVSRPTAH